MSNNSDDLKFHSDKLLGVLVWLQLPGGVQADEHTSAMKIFGEHNLQAIEILRKISDKQSKQIQVGIVKIDMPADEFETAALNAASKQAQKLNPCALIIQPGYLLNIDGSANRRYLLCSFFSNKKALLVLARPNTQINLE